MWNVSYPSGNPGLPLQLIAAELNFLWIPAEGDVSGVGPLPQSAYSSMNGTALRVLFQSRCPR